MAKPVTPEMLALDPNVEDCDVPPYDWDRQMRGAQIHAANQKQTFDGNGKPNDSTYSGGQTSQTFDGNGKPNDSRYD